MHHGQRGLGEAWQESRPDQEPEDAEFLSSSIGRGFPRRGWNGGYGAQGGGNRSAGQENRVDIKPAASLAASSAIILASLAAVVIVGYFLTMAISLVVVFG